MGNYRDYVSKRGCLIAALIWSVTPALQAIFFLIYGRTIQGSVAVLAALSLLTLVWGALWLCLTPSGPSLVIWAALLLALAGSSLWSWRKFYLLHQSSTEHEEESQHER